MTFARYVKPLLVLALIAAACNGSGGASNATGTLILTTAEGSIRSYDIASGESEPLLEPLVPGGRLLYPSVSPSGNQLVYVAQSSLTSGVADAGMDIWVAARDGSGARLVFEHTNQNQQVLYPQWQDEERLLAVVQEQGPGGVVFQLQRIDIATGARTPLAEGVFGFAVSRDGTQIAVSTLALDGLALSLAGPNAEALAPLLTPADGLSPFGFAQFSPDGTSIAFSSAELAGAAAQQQLIAFGPPADGAPQDIWATSLSDVDPRRVAELVEDSPALAWNGDGTRIYTQGAKGLYEVNLENGALNRLDDGVFHGHIAFAP